MPICLERHQTFYSRLQRINTIMSCMKAVLFDLDDTLFDHRHSARCGLQAWQALHPPLRQFSLEFLEQEDFRLLGEKHALVLAGTLTVDQARIERVQLLFSVCGEKISIDRARKLAARRVEVYRK